jgi:2-polyprenyl-6-hydroxyphenyl methylase/3-demethylubiquinone-9 3-methyltransferase
VSLPLDRSEPSGPAPSAAPEPRFPFGENWRRFLSVLNEERIAEAQRSLTGMLGLPTLAGRRFLDLGCGSGLFSLAARRLGARVHSLDVDPEAVACARTLRQRYFPADPAWTIGLGSVLDGEHLAALGPCDVVYSWGVLHHTGHLWRALDLAAAAVAPGGALAIAIYNDQGWRSRLWRMVKRTYLAGPLRRGAVLAAFVPCFFLGSLGADLTRGRDPRERYRTARRRRGMSPLHDWVDWLGGYPFEVAGPEVVVAFCRQRGLVLEWQQLTRSHGNNQFLFRRADARDDFRG